MMEINHTRLTATPISKQSTAANKPHMLCRGGFLWASDFINQNPVRKRIIAITKEYIQLSNPIFPIWAEKF